MLIDCHNDTAYRMFFEKQGLYSNNLHIDIKKQEKFQTLLFYAIFIDPDKTDGDVDGYFYKIYNNFLSEAERNYIQITDSLPNDKVENSAILTLEGGSFIDSLEKVDILKKLMIKSVTLTWNDSNKIATSQMSGDKGGVTPFGYKVLDKMLENKMIADLSHISDHAFYDIMDYITAPVLVSHSNSRKLCPFPRNITDDMFLRVIKNGGVTGINFCPDFLGEKPNIDTIVEHIEHFLSLGGENHIGFGSDFDGIPALPEGMKDFSSFDLVIEKMLKRNISEEIINKITYKNVLNLLKYYN